MPTNFPNLCFVISEDDPNSFLGSFFLHSSWVLPIPISLLQCQSCYSAFQAPHRYLEYYLEDVLSYRWIFFHSNLYFSFSFQVFHCAAHLHISRHSTLDFCIFINYDSIEDELDIITIFSPFSPSKLIKGLSKAPTSLIWAAKGEKSLLPL